jgi:hypothetical protein
MNEQDRQPTSQDMDTVRFISLVSMFASSAYMSMGKIANPATGKAERDLDAARGFIDILVMLKTKTAGNLTKDEDKIITSTISDLQMNFVKEKEKPEPEPEPAPAGEEKAGEEEKDSGPIVTPPPEEEEKEQ